jgi:hypothetical protein
VGNKSDLESARQVSTQEGKGTISINFRYIRRKKFNSDII